MTNPNDPAHPADDRYNENGEEFPQVFPGLSEHTPGPWIVDPYTQAIEQAAIEICQIDGEAISLCVVSTNKFRATKETMEANARLIAAAPELLDVVESIMSRMAFGQVCKLKHSDVDAMRAALAKAKGEQP